MILWLGGIIDKDSKAKEYQDVMEDTLSDYAYLQKELNEKKTRYFFYGLLVMAVVGIIIFNNYSTTKYVCSNGQTVDSSDLCFTSTLQISSNIDGSLTTCYGFKEARTHIGETGCIKGEVVQVFTSATGNTFLNYCSNYKTCPFSAVIFSSDSGEIPNPQKYSGKNVEITGLIRAYQGNAEIILKSSDQVKIK